MTIEFTADSQRSFWRYLALVTFLIGMAFWELTRDSSVMIHGIPAHVCGWSLVAILGLLLPSMLMSPYLGPGPHVIIDDHGIDDRAGGHGLIPWEDIVSMTARLNSKGSGRKDFLDVQVRDKAKYWARMSLRIRMWAWMNPALGHSQILMNFAAVEPGLPERMTELKEILRERTARGLYIPEADL